jgi:hypothetical protein
MTPLQTGDAGRVTDEDEVGEADEKSTLDDTDYPANPFFERCGIGDRAEVAVEDPIAAVSVERLAFWGAPQIDPCGLRFESAPRRLPAEVYDLHGDRRAFP